MAPLGHKRGHLKKEMEAPIATEIAERAGRDLKKLTRTAPQVNVVRKVEHFRETATRQANFVFCVHCGSTNIDQNSLHELYCYDCENRMAWDGLAFGIARTRGVDLEDQRCTPAADDAERAFKLRERTPPWVEAKDASYSRNKQLDPTGRDSSSLQE